MNTLTKVLLGIPVLVILITIMPFSLALPDSIYNFLIDNPISYVFGLVDYFLPLEFMLTCFLFIMLSKYASLLFSIINWIFHKIF